MFVKMTRIKKVSFSDDLDEGKNLKDCHTKSVSRAERVDFKAEDAKNDLIREC